MDPYGIYDDDPDYGPAPDDIPLDYGPAWSGFTEPARPFTEDPRWKRLSASDRRLMKALLAATHNPLTGQLQARAVDLAELLEISEEALRQSRLRLIEAGLILRYQPGTGRTASTYRLALSWGDVDGSAATP